MSQTKAQLIAPVGVVTASGVVVTGVMTAASFDGDFVGTASSIVSGSNLNLGTLTAGAGVSAFSGDFTGTATGIQTGAAISVGAFTATSFTGDFTGTATSMARGTGFEAGTVTSTAANVTYVVTVSGGDFYLDSLQQPTPTLYPGATYTFDQSDSTNGTHPLRFATAADAAGSTEYTDGVTTNGTPGSAGAWTKIVVPRNAPTPLYYYCSNHSGMGASINITNQLQGNVTGNVTGNITGLAATVLQGSNIHIGVITATSYHGDGSNLTGIAATNFNTQTVTANSGATTIDLSAGNCITMNQSSSTTVSFANTSEAMDVTLVRKKDDTSTARTITWPSSVKWNGDTAPTLITSAESDDYQQFQFITRDSGVTWYAWENSKYSPPYIELYSWGYNYNGNLGQNKGPSSHISSPTQIGTESTWGTYLQSANYSFHANKSDGTGWFWGNNGWNGGFTRDWSPTQAKLSSPTQVMGSDWLMIRTTSSTGAAINTDGELWVCGRNSSGQLGQNENGNPASKSSPVQIPGTNWYDVHLGASMMIARKTDGTLWTWGNNANGQLGLNQDNPSLEGKSSPTQVGTNTNWGGTSASDRDNYGMKATAASFRVVKTDGTLWTWGFGSGGGLGHNESAAEKYSSPKQVGTDTTWRQLGSDSYQDFMLARKSDGTLWGVGRNNHRQMSALPNGEISSPTQVGTDTDWSVNFDGGDDFCGAIKTNGNLYMWGKNEQGQLGQNESGNPSALPAMVQVPGTWLSFANAYSTAVATKSA
mgnify:CR=1 FL=1